MALTKKDLLQLKEVISTEITTQLSTQLAAQDARFEHRLKIALDQQSQDIKQDIRDEMDARFTAFENKINTRFSAHDQQCTLIKVDIQAIIDLLLTFIPERFEKLEHDVVRIKTRIGMAA